MHGRPLSTPRHQKSASALQIRKFCTFSHHEVDPMATYVGNSASGHAWQINGNITNNSYHYTLERKRTDATLRRDKRNGALLRAAARGQTSRILNLLQLGADIDYSDEHGFQALHYAALSGYEDTVKRLLEKGADLHAESLDCGTALHLAALKSRAVVVDLLLTHRADPGAGSRFLGSVLHCASYAGHIGILQRLISCGINTSSCDTVIPSLLGSIRDEGDINVDFESSGGTEDGFFVGTMRGLLQCAPVVLAVLAGHLDIIEQKLLPRPYCDCPTWPLETLHDGERTPRPAGSISPLFISMASEKDDMLRAVIKMGFSPDSVTSDGTPALVNALLYGTLEVARTLLALGANRDLEECHIKSLYDCVEHSGGPMAVNVRYIQFMRIELDMEFESWPWISKFARAPVEVSPRTGPECRNPDQITSNKAAELVERSNTAALSTSSTYDSHRISKKPIGNRDAELEGGSSDIDSSPNAETNLKVPCVTSNQNLGQENHYGQQEWPAGPSRRLLEPIMENEIVEWNGLRRRPTLDGLTDRPNGYMSDGPLRYPDLQAVEDRTLSDDNSDGFSGCVPFVPITQEMASSARWDRVDLAAGSKSHFSRWNIFAPRRRGRSALWKAYCSAMSPSSPAGEYVAVQAREHATILRATPNSA
ncbi:Ankyrin-2 [Pseudocercospora fuligena]|uniref:Ankyrin-2 n=1 Tax=Pseudocercospora fuligena TaxID=685502 RepID=A0A8H6RD02_9PEZI|nr:Ankyrin-2 [Pseudocercospora fuligena]